MGCQVETTDTGIEVEVHRFDSIRNAEGYVTDARGYVAERSMPTASGPSMYFFKGPIPGERASIRVEQIDASRYAWRAAFWIDGDVRVVKAALVQGEPAWHGQYRLNGQWLSVCNASGNAISYADIKSALAGGEFLLWESSRK